LPGVGAAAMPPFGTSTTYYRLATDAVARHGVAYVALVAAFHLAAIAVMAATEVDFAPKLLFILTWGLLNCFFLAVLRRPATAAALSLLLIFVLVMLSLFKHDKLQMTVNFVDTLIIDPDTVAFLLMVYPDLGRYIAIPGAIACVLLVLLWRLDRFKVRRGVAASGGFACLAGVAALSFAAPGDFYDEFLSDRYVSKYVRSGVAALSELATRGYMESDAAVADRLKLAAGETCAPQARRPHIILLHDESSFDIRIAPGVKVPEGYGRHFSSHDGRKRALVVEGVGGPSWFTEYNVLTGLSARSYGRFAESVTRIAAGRIERGLPMALRRCGYKTFSLYPTWGAFMSARGFQTTAGIEHFLDMKDMGTRQLEPDSFYYDFATRLMARERDSGPLFLFVYTAANHFPWDTRYRPDLMPDWRDLGNEARVDEYLRRQTLGARDYADFLARLRREFPGEPFLIVRYGDHQPEFAYRILEPSLDEPAVLARVRASDPRYFTTYYAIDAVNFTPAETSSALDTLDAPYLPIVIQEAARLPLDASFAEQKRILERCRGRFYLCAQGAEVRRFNRLLIDAGLIKGL
jgi:hypothetical protein